MKIDTHIHLYDPAQNLSWPQPVSSLQRFLRLISWKQQKNKA